ncbi:MAG: methyltransferase domain-containing protein [Bacteroidetes bacterium]|nr:methyltransferase domain-containing protein [Bacteroidota bacterium]
MDILNRFSSYLSPVSLRAETGKLTARLEVAWENGCKVLNAQTVNYSFGPLHQVFRNAITSAGIPEFNPQSVLILGYGAGSIAHILTRELGLSPQITGVDADETVLQLAREEFEAGTIPNQSLLCARAENFLLENTAKYDLICVDLFVEAHVPPQCQTLTFITNLHTHLRNGGKLLYNFIRHTPHGHAAIQNNLAAVFSHTEALVMNMGEADNLVWICTK